MGLGLQPDADVFDGAGDDGVGDTGKGAGQVVLTVREARIEGARCGVGGFEASPRPVEGAELYGYLVCESRLESYEERRTYACANSD